MSLEIIPVTDTDVLPNSTPSLMPFHISYDGPAPISRYFRPKPAPPSSTFSTRSSSLATLVASSSSSSQLTVTDTSPNDVTRTRSAGELSVAQERDDGDGEEALKTRSLAVVQVVEKVQFSVDATVAPKREDSAMDVDSDTQPISTPLSRDDSSVSTLVSPPSKNAERFVAAFRGRQMYGQAVEIPEGYGGLVLRTPVGEKAKAKGDPMPSSKVPSKKGKPKARSTTRRSRRTMEDEAMADAGGDESDSADSPADPLLPTKKLIPTSTFSSFTLWTPDIPLDEGKDEYVRALMEWTRLAAEIHSYE